MYHLVARSIEASCLRKSRICIRRKEEAGRNYPLLVIDIERTKMTLPMYSHLLYPHCDILLFDWYFSIAYILVMQWKIPKFEDCKCIHYLRWLVEYYIVQLKWVRHEVNWNDTKIFTSEQHPYTNLKETMGIWTKTTRVRGQ